MTLYFIYTLLATGLLYLFRRSLVNVTSYRFYVFWGIESLLLLVLINLRWWFVNLWSARQIASFTLLVFSALMVLSALYAQRIYGKPLQKLVSYPHLITRGIYGSVRHPLFSSLLLLTMGISLKHQSLFSLILTAISAAAFIAAAFCEERENMDIFADVYGSYKRVTKMFIPFVL
jgi:protein-S-isoprenylcysteine O-methyltransferase Ste14